MEKKQINQKEVQRSSAKAGKTKTPQIPSAGPLEFVSQRLDRASDFLERILTLAGKVCRLYKLVSEVIEQFNDTLL